jgi:hypothetical protein
MAADASPEGRLADRTLMLDRSTACGNGRPIHRTDWGDAPADCLTTVAGC